jgi:hypothetical protein
VNATMAKLHHPEEISRAAWILGHLLRDSCRQFRLC